MDTLKITVEELRSYEPERLREVEDDARKALLDIRMDYTMAAPDAGKIRKYKAALARIKTIQTEKKNKVVPSESRS